MEEQKTAGEVITINPKLAQRIQEGLGQNVYLCYQCVKCTSGCPLAEFFDWQPNQVMRSLQLGQEDIALHSRTPWLCASCQTCTTRCPQGLDIAAIMAFLTREALARDIPPKVPEVDICNQAFLREVQLWGRSYELGLMAEMKLRTRKFTDDLDLGAKMLQKNKLPFLPERARPPKQVKPAAAETNSVAYYPGCSLHSTATEYNTSTKAVCEALGMNLIEPRGWVCCGSTPVHRANPDAAMRLPMENLRLVEQSGLDEVVMPCAACFNHTRAAQYEIRHNPDRKAGMEKAMGYVHRDSVRVSALGEAIFRRIGPQGVAAKVRRPLKDLRLVCYYGCLLTRPPAVTEAAHPENPTDLDGLMAALGAEIRDWSYKTTCCGATHSLTRPDIVLTLSRRIIDHAREAGAEAIAVACPLCHTNLDARQFQMKLGEPMPILYFTQLMALALDMTEKAALHKNLVDPRPLLQSKGLL
jgi:heterodisulfide reductase subunit B